MQFGIAKEIITPDVLTHMGGYGSRYGKFFQGIHDDLYVKVLLLDDGNTKVILISLDLVFHDYALTERFKDYVKSKYNVSEDNLVISYTHTHAGPAVASFDLDQASEEYETFLYQRIESCIDRAFINTFDGRIAFCTIEGDWNINRRKEVDGSIHMWPNPEGVKDNTLNLLKICDNEDHIKALVLNYSCHPVTLSDTLFLSSEYPGRICQLLDSMFYGNTSIFFQGAGANARPKITVSGNAFKRCTFDEVDDMATVIANNVQKAIYRGKFEDMELGLAAKQFVIPLDIESYPKEKLQEMYEQSREDLLKNVLAEILRDYDKTEDVVYLHAGIVKLNNNSYIAFMCGEVCYEVKCNVIKVFEDKKVIFIGYGDDIGYIPDDKIIREGGYEGESSAIGFRLKGRFKEGIDKRIFDAYKENMI